MGYVKSSGIQYVQFNKNNTKTIHINWFTHTHTHFQLLQKALCTHVHTHTQVLSIYSQSFRLFITTANN